MLLNIYLSQNFPAPPIFGIEKASDYYSPLSKSTFAIHHYILKYNNIQRGLKYNDTK